MHACAVIKKHASSWPSKFEPFNKHTYKSSKNSNSIPLSSASGTMTTTTTIAVEMRKMQFNGKILLKQTVTLDSNRCSARLVLTMLDPITHEITTTTPEDFSSIIDNPWRTSGNYKIMDAREFRELQLDQFEKFHVNSAYVTGITSLYLFFKDGREVIAYNNWNDDMQFLLYNKL